MGEQQVVHPPELALGGRRLGRLRPPARRARGRRGAGGGGRRSAGRRRSCCAELLDRAGRAAAEGAFEVAVLDERQRRVGPAADVVSLGVDRARSRNIGSAGGALAAKTAASRKTIQPRQRSRATAGHQHADGGVRRAGAGESNARPAMSSATVKPMPDSAAPPTTCPDADALRQASPRPSRTAPQRAHADAGELADDEAEDDAPGDAASAARRRAPRRAGRRRRWRARRAARSRSSSRGAAPSAGARSSDTARSRLCLAA